MSERSVVMYLGKINSLRQGTPSEVAALVLNGKADFSIATKPVDEHDGLVMLPCYELQRIILTPARHPLLKIKKLTLDALVRYPLITYDFAFMVRSEVTSAFERAGLTPNIALNAIDADVIKTYVDLSLGIAIIPEIAYQRKIDNSLRGIKANHLFAPNIIYLGLRRDHYLRNYAYTFINYFAPRLTRKVVEKALRVN
ncbi:MAG: LysR substrate-binding domain-containing protein [Rickettsiales bacterium]|jgi:LysR family cys regulon transcriptional activator